MLGSVDFVSIPSREPDRARAFYIDTLGLRADEHARYEFWCGSTCFCIWQPERIGWEWAPQKNGHIAFHVEDVAAARAELEAKGVEFAGETFDTGVSSACTQSGRLARLEANSRADGGAGGCAGTPRERVDSGPAGGTLACLAADRAAAAGVRLLPVRAGSVGQTDPSLVSAADMFESPVIAPSEVC
jgi:catechol 2,3-dioxygenase-like lactoylglutathione lyase family enzyme